LCGFFTTEEICDICADSSRSPELLCVVEHPTDILPLEKTSAFRGRYHSLGGKISPLDHVEPDDLRIKELLERLEREKISEVIFALSTDVEGEATTNYLVDLLRAKPVTLTRIARGIPAGGGLESTDELTLSAALTGRTKLCVAKALKAESIRFNASTVQRVHNSLTCNLKSSANIDP